MSHRCYDRRVTTEIASRELRNDTGALLRRVEAGEQVVITVAGRAVARLLPLERHRPTWMPRAEFMQSVLPYQADPGLRSDLKELVPDTTDDLPL